MIKALLALAVATAPSPALANGHEFIGSADDGTVYAGRTITVLNGQVIGELLEVLPDGTQDTFVMAFNCADGVFKDNGAEAWETPTPESVGEGWFNYFCN